MTILIKEFFPLALFAEREHEEKDVIDDNIMGLIFRLGIYS